MSRRYTKKNWLPYHEYKKKHDAEQFSSRICGLDEDIKKILFELNQIQLNAFFKFYEDIHGKRSVDYAKRTFEDWSTGEKNISKLILPRIIELAPKAFNHEQRYNLILKIYSNKKYRIRDEFAEFEFILGKSEPHKTVSNKLQEICERPMQYKIPKELSKVMTWLCDDNSLLIQNVISAIEKDYCSVIAIAAKSELNRLIKLIESIDSSVVGSHEIEFPYDKIRIIVRHQNTYEKIHRFIFGS